MDQIAALHWVQENVAYFGGDPASVTLIGHGTGAACVNFLMTSHAVPDGKILFDLLCFLFFYIIYFLTIFFLFLFANIRKKKKKLYKILKVCE